MMSLAELRRAVAIVDRECAGARVEKIVQPDARRIVLTLYRGARGEVHLLFCCEPRSARLSVIETRPAAPPAPPGFAQLLRARLGGARVAGARIVDGDRQAALRFEGEAGDFELLLAILGPRTNLHLLDGEGHVLGALRPLGETRRDLAIGSVWKSPASKPPDEGGDRCAACCCDRSRRAARRSAITSRRMAQTARTRMNAGSTRARASRVRRAERA